MDLSCYEQLDSHNGTRPPETPTTAWSSNHLHNNPTTPTPQCDPPPDEPTTTNDIPFDPNPDVEDTSPFALQWSDRLRSTTTFEDFATACSEYAAAAVAEGRLLASQLPGMRRHQKPPERRPLNRFPNPRRRQLAYNPREAGRIQSLYRHSKKRAIRQILKDTIHSYTGTKEAAHQYYEHLFRDTTIDTDNLLRSLKTHVPSASLDESLLSPFSNLEIRQRLTSMNNSAPGSDRVEYRHLRLVDPHASTLRLIFNRCLIAGRIPAHWKQSTTVLIHKKGPTDDPTNFRPIALMSCLYKLFMSLLASRISHAAIDKGLMSPNQKSARPHEGCHEHSFALQTITSDCKRNQKNVFIAWLDLRNAFGSIPHEAIYTTLAHMGFPVPLITLLKAAYDDSTTTIRTQEGETSPIPIKSGVKQGCPISAILFNLTAELLIRTVLTKAAEDPSIPYALYGQKISVLAYADDLVLISRTRAGLQAFLDATSTAADTLHLSFRPDKCATLGLTYNRNETSRIGDTTFTVQQHPITPMNREDKYRYLGVPIGMERSHAEFVDIATSLANDLTKIQNSALAPWQKLDAIRTFIQPCFTYALRACSIPRSALSNYRSTLATVVRSICHLPRRAATSYLYASKYVGGLALQDPYYERHVQAIVHTLKMLSSTDPMVAALAQGQLSSVVHRCLHRQPSSDEIDQFLSGSMNNGLGNHGRASNGHTLWSRARLASRHLHLILRNTTSTDPLVSTLDGSSSANHKASSSFLHKYIQDMYADDLRAKPDQGKVARAIDKDKYATSSTWHYDGTGIRFCDWRFIHRARTNTLPTNANKSRWSQTNPTCRRCHRPNQPETLPHILCHCHPNMVPIRKRHDKIVNRLRQAIYRGEVAHNQTVPGAPRQDRPDLVIRDGNTAIVIDVACPFENDENALQAAADRKVQKYQYLTEHFAQQNVTTKIFGFVVGALGSWFPKNEEVLNALKISHRYRKLFRKLCCADTIQGSRDIYTEHYTNQRQ